MGRGLDGVSVPDGVELLGGLDGELDEVGIVGLEGDCGTDVTEDGLVGEEGLEIADGGTNMGELEIFVGVDTDGEVAVDETAPMLEYSGRSGNCAFPDCGGDVGDPVIVSVTASPKMDVIWSASGKEMGVPEARTK